MQELIKNEKFLIVKTVKSFILDLENLLQTFPKKDMYTKNMVYRDALAVLELINKANYEARKEIKLTYQIEALAKINKIDFYLERAYRLRYISEKQCMNASAKLGRLNKMIYAWCSNA